MTKQLSFTVAHHAPVNRIIVDLRQRGVIDEALLRAVAGAGDARHDCEDKDQESQMIRQYQDAVIAAYNGRQQ